MAQHGICTNDVPNKRDMMELQANIAVHLPSGADAPIYSLSTLAVYDMYTYQGLIGSCAKGRWNTYADWNGVNN